MSSRDRTSGATRRDGSPHSEAIRWASRSSALIRLLTHDEANDRWAACFHYTEGQGECGGTPCFRIATPHGHFDACGDHVDGLLVSLPPEWLEGWRERDPLTLGASDDIPF